MASVASTYARAFADVVFSAHLDANRVIGGMRRISALLAESEELRRVWENPAIAAEQKRGVLDAIVRREGFSRPVRNFVAVLIDHRRIALLEEVLQDCEKELNRRLGFAEAQITSARELSSAERRALESQVEKLTGKKIRARYGRDESILGGAIVQVGSTIYDGSVKGQLERIREQLAAT